MLQLAEHLQAGARTQVVIEERGVEALTAQRDQPAFVARLPLQLVRPAARLAQQGPGQQVVVAAVVDEQDLDRGRRIGRRFAHPVSLRVA